MGTAGDVLILIVGDESNESRKELQKAWRVGVLFTGQGVHSSHRLIKRDPPGMEDTARPDSRQPAAGHSGVLGWVSSRASNICLIGRRKKKPNNWLHPLSPKG